MQNNTAEGKPVIVNALTSSYLEDIENVSNEGGEVFYPIKKIYRKSLNAEREREYYVSWKNHPTRDNFWIQEDHFTEELKNRSTTLKLPEIQYRV